MPSRVQSFDKLKLKPLAGKWKGDRKTQDYDHIRNSSQWQRLRRAMMLENPVCPDPFGRHGEVTVPSKEVHHIIPLSQDVSKAYQKENLLALCQSCHAIADRDIVMSAPKCRESKGL